MASRDLPARPHLDHLKNEAKALHKSAREGDPAALQRVREVIGDVPALKLTDAQRVVAREYGFPTWARLRAHVQSIRDVEEPIQAFIGAVEMQDVERARRVLTMRPAIAAQNLHVAAVLGNVENAKRLIEADPSAVKARAGNNGGEPLLFLCYSPFHGESADRDAGLLATARVLLEAGADPNTADRHYGVPALYAVTGPRAVLPIAKLLLDAGAKPNDGESLFHAAEAFHEDALLLLLEYGADVNYVGEWGNTPLYFLLRWHDVANEPRVRQGFEWLLEHGADPNVPCGRERENSLHVAARRGQSPAIVTQLLERGADMRARRGDGSGAWLLAKRGGHEEIAQLLERAGAETQPLSAADRLFAACNQGDAETARRLTSPEVITALTAEDRLFLNEAADADRVAIIEACLAAGFPVDTVDFRGATALHYTAIHGRAHLVRQLIAMGADMTVRDREHSATPLGWATFGVDHMPAPDGDYVGTVRALLDAGSPRDKGEPLPQHEGVRALLTSAGSGQEAD